MTANNACADQPYISEQEQQRIIALQKLLKPARGPPPAFVQVAVALRVASGDKAAINRLPSSGPSRKRAMQLHDRIVDGKLLEKIAPAESEEATSCMLLVQPAWIQQHTPGIRSLDVHELQLDD